MQNNITVTVIDREGVPHQLEGPTDMSLNLMELCKAYELPLTAVCGGMALCATCQCYVESDTALPDVGDSEQDMLDTTCCAQENSRLSCQLQLSQAMDGMVVRLAPE